MDYKPKSIDFGLFLFVNEIIIEHLCAYSKAVIAKKHDLSDGVKWACLNGDNL